jgi:hypothetical protein
MPTRQTGQAALGEARRPAGGTQRVEVDRGEGADLVLARGDGVGAALGDVGGGEPSGADGLGQGKGGKHLGHASALARAGRAGKGRRLSPPPTVAPVTQSHELLQLNSFEPLHRAR